MITTHVLDLAHGEPAVGVQVILEVRGPKDWEPVGRGVTDVHGRLTNLVGEHRLHPATYRLTFDLGDYHRERGVEIPFFPEAKVIFNVRDALEHYHVPLLISPYGYTTYRGT
jgi:5-hydroxyisourate hydrolase